jgi:FtsP/CotA-like multicopper oxidase with cupredoxin domain
VAVEEARHAGEIPSLQRNRNTLQIKPLAKPSIKSRGKTAAAHRHFWHGNQGDPEIVNSGGMMMMDVDHPFHIHTNAFQVLDHEDLGMMAVIEMGAKSAFLLPPIFTLDNPKYSHV